MRVGRGCFGEQLATEEAPEFFGARGRGLMRWGTNTTFDSGIFLYDLSRE